MERLAAGIVDAKNLFMKLFLTIKLFNSNGLVLI